MHIKIGYKTRVHRFLANVPRKQVTGISLTALKWNTRLAHLTEGETSCSTFALIQLADTHVHCTCTVYVLTCHSLLPLSHAGSPVQKARGRHRDHFTMHNTFAWNYLSVFRVYVCVSAYSADIASGEALFASCSSRIFSASFTPGSKFPPFPPGGIDPNPSSRKVSFFLRNSSVYNRLGTCPLYFLCHGLSPGFEIGSSSIAVSIASRGPSLIHLAPATLSLEFHRFECSRNTLRASVNWLRF